MRVDEYREALLRDRSQGLWGEQPTHGCGVVGLYEVGSHISSFPCDKCLHLVDPVAMFTARRGRVS